MPSRRAVAALLTVTLTLGTAASGVAATGHGVHLSLPAPTGSHPVGITTLHLTDTSRQDPWVPAVGARELLVSLWYPARSADTRPAPYLTPSESELLLAGAGIDGVPPDVLSRVRTNAHPDARPASGRRLPLVLLSPGFGWPRSSLTTLAEELASRGYLVAGIDHTYENFAMTFPDGRVVTCAACELAEPDVAARAVTSRARDVSFVLDELLDERWGVDPTRVALVGMSLGGSSVAETMRTDRRVLAGVNLDGALVRPVPASGLARPYLIMGTANGEESWVANWPRLTGWKRWLAVGGSIHSSFTDYDLLTQRLGLDFGSGLVGTRSVEITLAYVRAFVDHHLLARPRPLLDRPSPRYPEVTFATGGS